MKTRLFYTTGNRDIIETTWDKPEPSDDQIEVKSVYTGVCRSDIDMYVGKFTLPSIYMQGHEGLGQVTKVGKNIKEKRIIEVGQYVATRGEPAFSDYYNVNEHDFVEVYSYEHDVVDPKYIIEPVACGVNLVAESIGLKNRGGYGNELVLNFAKNTWEVNGKDEPNDILILGTGFLARVVYATLIENHKDLNITVVGKANQSFWITQPVTYMTDIEELYEDERFNVIFDISDKTGYVAPEIHHLADAGTLVVAAEKKKPVIYPTSELLWKSAKVIYPSPRSKNFHSIMAEAMCMVNYGQVSTEDLWTQEYDRETEVKQAFEDGLNREKGYSRGYIKW